MSLLCTQVTQFRGAKCPLGKVHVLVQRLTTSLSIVFPGGPVSNDSLKIKRRIKALVEELIFNFSH